MRSITVQNLKKLVFEEKASEILKEEILKVLGPVINYSPKLENMIAEANDRLEVLERTGRISSVNFKPSSLLKFSKHKNPEVRKFLARTLPQAMLERFMYDESPEVRHAAARRLPISKLKEMASYYKRDDELNEIKRFRLDEAARKMSADSRYGDRMQGMAKQHDGPEIGGQWYVTHASKAIKELNGTIEGQWQWPYVNQFHANAGIDFDRQKLYDEIMAQLDAKDDEALVQDKLKDAAKRVFEGSYLRSAFLEDEKSIYSDILSRRTSSLTKVNLCMQVFDIKESQIPNNLKRMRLLEGFDANVSVPSFGRVPSGHAFTHEVERSLDAFQDSWNALREAAGDNLRISWAPDPTSLRKFLFTLETK
jgi:hypothetical protein